MTMMLGGINEGTATEEASMTVAHDSPFDGAKVRGIVKQRDGDEDAQS